MCRYHDHLAKAFTVQCKSLTMENFDEWLVIRQSFSYKHFCFSFISHKQFSKVFLVKVL